MNLIPWNTAGPDHSSVTEIQSLGPSKHTAQTQSALVSLSPVPTVVGNN